MSDDVPTGLLLVPASGAEPLGGVLRKLGLLALRRLLVAPEATVPAALAGPLARLRSLLAAHAPHAPAALRAAIGAPDVLGPLLCVESGAADLAAVVPAVVPSFLLAATRAGPALFEEALLWDVPVACIPDPPAGRAYRFEPPALGLVADRNGIEVRLASGRLVRLPRAEAPAPDAAGLEVEACFHRLWGPEASAHLALLDSNPIASLEEHPGKRGNAVDLGGRPVEDWLAALRAALELVALGLPALAAEFALSLRRVVPVGFEAERHLSASYREAPGLAYLTLHPSPHVLAEAIIHETQHGKLNALSWFDPVLRNGRDEWTRSPVRPDPRPLVGVLLAVHAFVPVAALHRRLVELGHAVAATDSFRHRRATVLAQNAEGLATLSRLGDWTPLGERLRDDLVRLHDWSAHPC